MRGANSTKSPGIRVNTDRRLKRIAFISTMDMSMPILNFMKASAAKPLMVVSEEPLISGMALDRAAIAASRALFVSCSSEKRC